MDFTVFNVKHGFCGYLIADTKNVALFDCGHGEKFQPSKDLPKSGCNGIEKFFLSNFDQDHVSDLVNLRKELSIHQFYRNRTIPEDKLRSIKLEAGPITRQMDQALDLHSRYVSKVSEPDFGSVEFLTYHNNYPEFKDTNNLSLVIIIKYNNLGIIYPGDLEKDGWDSLLDNNISFRKELGNVNIFIASHHGREGGYNERIFDYCSPDIVIISDKEIVHDTQKSLYAKHATGVTWEGGGTRSVLTTRSDGHINIKLNADSGYHITTDYNL